MRNWRSEYVAGDGLLARLVLAVALLFSAYAPAQADELSRVFQQLMADPANPALNVRYAELAMARGETGRALAAYERALASDPDNRAVRRAYRRAKVALQPAVTAFTLSTGLRYESNPRQVFDSSPFHEDDVGLEAALLMFDERSLAGHRWRTLGRASGHLQADVEELNDAYLSIASGPVFDISKTTQLHVAPGAATAWLDDDWLYTDGSLRLSLERRHKGNAQTLNTTIKYRDTNSDFDGDDGMIVQVDGRFLKTGRFRQGDALYFLPRFRYSEPGGNGPDRVFQSALFPGNYIEYGGRVVYYSPIARKRAYLGAGIGVYQRDYDQNVAFSTNDRSDVMIEPTAHLLVPNVRGSQFDFRVDYRFENNDSNDATEDFDNHVVSVTTVRKF